MQGREPAQSLVATGRLGSGALRFRRAVRLVVGCALILVGLNIAFTLVRLLDNAVDKQVVAAALRSAFATGSFGTDPYPLDTLQGFDRYSDCITAQVAAIGAPSWLEDALAPRIVSPEQVGPDFRARLHNVCLELKQVVDRTLDREPSETYTRFWHGAASVFSAAMLLLPVDGYRALLLDATLGLIALCAILAALRDRALLGALAPLLLMSFVFGGQMSYGHLISYGPATIVAWLVAALIIRCEHRLGHRGLIYLASAAGALEAFFDQIISVPLAVSIFLIVAGLVSVPRWLGRGSGAAAIDVAAYATAWLFGFGGSYVIKLALSIAVLGTEAFRAFVDQLSYRAGTIDLELGFDASHPVTRIEIVGQGIVGLISNVWRLFYANSSDAALVGLTVTAIGMLGWCAACLGAARAFRGGDGARFAIGGAPYLAAAIFLAVWVFALPEHTMRHGFFMVRATVIWLCGGWGVLWGAQYAGALRGGAASPSISPPGSFPR